MQNRTDIFPYFNGAENVWGDPLEIQQTLTAALDGDVNKCLREARAAIYEDAQGNPLPQPEPDVHAHNCIVAHQALNRLIPAIRLAFVMQDFNPATGEGATRKVCIEALNAFDSWTQLQKKSGEPDPTPSSDVEEPIRSNCRTSISLASG